jgi:predicted Zn-dependent peptidase
VRGIKLANTTTDPVSGGRLWTFNNGIKVIYKRDASTDRFKFCFAARGGASSVRDIRPGESAYLSDVLATGRIAGMSTYDFHQMLLSNGITLFGAITLEDMRIYGEAEPEDVESVLKALLKIGYTCEIDQDSYDYFRRSALIKTASVPPSIVSVMDSLICPDYIFLEKSSAHNLGDDLPERVQEYITRRFSNAADGIFIFTGNIAEEKLLQALTRYLGNFKTSRIYALREPVRYNLHSGRTTHVADGPDHSVNLAATGLFPANLDNYYAFLVAIEAIKKQLAMGLAPLGMYAEVSGKMDLSPVERMTLYITCRPCDQDGLPAGITASEPLAAIREIRREFDDLQYFAVTDAQFKAYKEIVRNNVARELATPEGIIKYCLYRYSEGKDFISLYSKSIDRVQEDDVRMILEEIISSGVVEYVVK